MRDVALKKHMLASYKLAQTVAPLSISALGDRSAVMLQHFCAQVAHYLILTHLSEQGAAMPMMDITNMRKRSRPEEQGQPLVDNPVFQQARLAYDISQDAHQRAGYAHLMRLLLICANGLIADT